MKRLIVAALVGFFAVPVFSKEKPVEKTAVELWVEREKAGYADLGEQVREREAKSVREFAEIKRREAEKAGAGK